MKRILPAAGALAALLGCNHEAAAPKTDTSAVLANVNGTRITQADFEARAKTLSTNPQEVQVFLTDAKYQAQRAQLVHQLAFEAAMTQIAVKNGIDQDPAALALLAKQRAAIYANVLVSHSAGNATPTEAQLKAFYDDLVTARKAAGQAQALPPFDQVKALPQFAEAWQKAQFQKAGDAFQKDLQTQVPVTYADGLQSPEAEY
ncbi:MAG TPA: hypothetical protein VFF77_01445 [Holophagaceae bacterium]|nr:hypothetical protein [Holophagaceae bacterium]